MTNHTEIPNSIDLTRNASSRTRILDTWLATPPRLDHGALERRIELLLHCENPKVAVLADAIFELAIDDAAHRLMRR
jgi:hypothetical protein